MLNQVVLVGRLTSDPELKEIEGKKTSFITLAIPRNYKNAEGEYETDFVTTKLTDSIAENTSEYCKKGDIIGIKGMVEGDLNKIEIKVEKVTFLSSSSNK